MEDCKLTPFPVYLATVEGMEYFCETHKQWVSSPRGCRPTKHAPDVVDSAASISISTASEVSALQGESNPAPTQVM